MTHFEIAMIKREGSGIDVTAATLAVVDGTGGGFSIEYRAIQAGIGCCNQTGIDLEPGGDMGTGAATAEVLAQIRME